MPMKVKTADEAYQTLEALHTPEISDHKDYPISKKLHRGILRMGYYLGATAALLGQSPKPLDELLKDQWIKDNLITEDSDATS